MTKTINREATVSFGDASVIICERGMPSGSGLDIHKKRDAWQAEYKREVFARVVQTLNRLGWTCKISQEYVERYGHKFALSYRECSKGDVKGWLEISVSGIKFEMWQGVNTPTRPDSGGRYESDKEACMPYVLRLEMERTRRRIRDYLCNVFSGYKFDSESRSIYRKPLQKTAMEIIQRRYAETWHFKGVDWDGHKKQPGMTYNLKAGDGTALEHGQRVWTTDHKGRWIEGTAYYNINNMWWVLLGRYDYTNKACFEIRTTPPENPRVKQNERQRRKRLETLLSDAVKTMDFDRANVIKGILWPTPEPLFHIIKNGAYFRPNYSGYTSDSVEAGKYTKDELKPYASDIKRGDLKAVPVSV